MASVDLGGGSGGKRDSNFEVNLVPFIDLMSVLITFLLIFFQSPPFIALLLSSVPQFPIQPLLSLFFC